MFGCVSYCVVISKVRVGLKVDRRGGGGGLPLLYRYVRPQTVGFFSRFGHKKGIDFGQFSAILVINRVSIFAL